MPRIPLSAPSVPLQPVFTGEGFDEQAQAQGLGNLAASFGALNEQLTIDRSRAQVSEAITTLRREMTDELEAIQKDPNRIDDLATGLEDRFAARADDLMAGIDLPEAQFQFRDAAAGALRQDRSTAFQIELRRKGIRADAQLSEFVVETNREMIATGTLAALEKARLDISEEVNRHAAAGHLSDDQAEEVVRLHSNAAEVALAKDWLGKNRFAELRAALDQGAFVALEADQIAQLGSIAENGQRSANAELMETRVLVDPFSVQESEILGPVDRNPFSEGGYERGHANSILRTWKSLIESKSKDTALYQYGLDIRNGKELFKNTPEDKKAIDLVYNGQLMAKGGTGRFDDPVTSDTLTEYLFAMGAFPPSAAERMVGVLNDKRADPSEKIATAQLLLNLSTLAPQVRAQFSKQEETADLVRFAADIVRQQRIQPKDADANQIVVEAERMRQEKLEESRGGPDVDSRLQTVLGERNLSEFVREQTTERSMFDIPLLGIGGSIASQVPLGVGSSIVEPQTWGEKSWEFLVSALKVPSDKGASTDDLLMRGVTGQTLQSAIDRMQFEGNDPMPEWLVTEVGETFRALFRIGGQSPRETLIDAWASVMEEVAPSRYADPRGQLIWSKGAPERGGEDIESGSGYAWIPQDTRRYILDTVRQVLPRIEAGDPEPGFSEQYAGFLRAIDPEEIQVGEGLLAGAPAEIARQMAGQASAQLTATVLSLADFADPDVADALKEVAGFIEKMEPLPELWSSREHSQSPKQDDGRGIFALHQKAVDQLIQFRLTRHPISDLRGENLFMVSFQDKKGRWRTLPHPNALGLPAIFSYDVASSPYVRERAERMGTRKTKLFGASLKAGDKESKAEQAERDAWKRVRSHPQTLLNPNGVTARAIGRARQAIQLLPPGVEPPWHELSKDPFAARAYLDQIEGK